jgi:hypothetical protein
MISSLVCIRKLVLLTLKNLRIIYADKSTYLKSIMICFDIDISNLFDNKISYQKCNQEFRKQLEGNP